MLFVIHCLDKDDALPTRTANIDAHRAYLSTATITTVMSGPLMSDDGEKILGSFFLVEAPDRAAVDAFHHGDPLYKAQIWKQVDITAFNKRVG